MRRCPIYEEPPESPISAPEVAADYPLVLTTGARISYFFNSEHRQIEKLRKAHRDPIAEIHPDTAARNSASRTATGCGSRRGAAACGRSAQADRRHRSARHRRRARLVVSRSSRRRTTACGRPNVNLLTDNQPPYDPAMGTYQLRALLCRVSKAGAQT